MWLNFLSFDLNMALCGIVHNELYVERAIYRGRLFRDRTNPLDYLNDEEMLARYSEIGTYTHVDFP